MTFEEAYDKIQAVACAIPERLAQLWCEASELTAEGAIAEFGVWRGGTAWLLAAASDKPLHLFDTFRGIPDSAVCEQDWHSAGDFSDTSVGAVQNLLLEYGDRIKYHVGEFVPERVPEQPFALVHIDADTYISYKLSLPRFWKLLSPRGVMILDDYGAPSCPGATIATEEFLAECDPKPLVTHLPGYGAILRRAASMTE